MYCCSIKASKTAVKVGEAVFSKLRRSFAVISSKTVPSPDMAVVPLVRDHFGEYLGGVMHGLFIFQLMPTPTAAFPPNLNRDFHQPMHCVLRKR